MKIRTVVKVLSLICTLLLIVIVAPLAYLFLSDANDFKPQLQQLALEQGVQLDIAGEINWQIYPDIKLEINVVDLKFEQDSFVLEAALGTARLQAELRPLFSGELKVRGVEVANSRLTITELAKADGVIPNEGSATADAEEVGSVPSVAFQKISFQNLDLEYKLAVGDTSLLSIDSLEIEGLNFAGSSFPVRLNTRYRSGQKDDQQDVQISTESLLSIDLDKQNYTLKTEQLNLKLDGEQGIELTAQVNSAIDLISNQWNLSLTQAAIDDLSIKVNASGSVEPLTALGQLALEGGSHFINNWAGQDLLQVFGLQAGFDYSPERVFLNEIAATFNDSNLTSSAMYVLAGNERSEFRLSLDKINLDQYLPQDLEEQDANLESAAEENPLSFLQNMPAADVFLNLGELSVSGQKLTDINVEVAIDNSEANIQLANATLAEGAIKGSVLARADETPQVVISSFTANQINLGPLTLNESGRPLLQGMAYLGFKGQLENLSGQSVLKGLNGGGQLSVKELQLADTNIEQSICASAKQLGATAALAEQWSSGTEFDQLASPYEINSGFLSLENISTGFGNIKLDGQGELDLDNMDFGARLSLLINGQRTSDQGCSINKYLRNTKLPLSCEGNLSEGGETSCGLDSSVVGELLKGQIKNALSRQLIRLSGDNKNQGDADAETENSSEAAEQDSSDQVKDAVKGLIEGLFK